MNSDILRTARPMTVCYWDADKTMRFFRLPTGAALTVIAGSSLSGCVEILYEQNSYVAFKRELYLICKR
jgi:hypothetical protein